MTAANAEALDAASLEDAPLRLGPPDVRRNGGAAETGGNLDTPSPAPLAPAPAPVAPTIAPRAMTPGPAAPTIAPSSMTPGPPSMTPGPLSQRPARGSTPHGQHIRRWFQLGNSALAWPLLAFFAVFVLLPVAMLVLASLGLDTGHPTLAHFVRFFTDRLSVPVLGRTLRLGLEVAALAVLLAYPLSLIFVAASPRLQRLLTLLITLPLLTSAVVRTFAWVVILGRQGLINQTLLALGLIRQPIPLLYTEPCLVVALAQIELPLMTLPLISALSAIDPRLAEASVALGAGRWRTFRRVTLPLSLPGAVAGLLLVFASACSALITQSIVGGGRLLFMPLYIYQQGMQAQDWPFAAAISLMLLLSVLSVVALVNWLGRLTQRHAHA